MVITKTNNPFTYYGFLPGFGKYGKTPEHFSQYKSYISDSLSTTWTI
jgi:hypothetical protein